MARAIDLRRREELVAAAARHLVENGLVDQSLSDIAAGAGTSARMLVHHFGTREALLARALELAREWQLADATRALGSNRNALATLEAAWQWLISPQTLNYFRLFQQVAALERLHGSDAGTAFSRRLRSDWSPLVTNAFAADPRFQDPGRVAQITITFIRGLALDLVRDPDSPRHRETFEDFLGLLRRLPRAAARRTRSRSSRLG